MKNNEMLKAWGEKDAGAPLEMVRVGFRSGLVFSDGSKGKESTCNAGDTGDTGSIPVWEDPLKKVMQHPCPKNSIDREAWQSTVQRVTESQT